LSEEHGKNTVNEHSRDYQAGLIKKSGGVPIALKDKYTLLTIKNCTCEFASIAGVWLTHKSIGKTRTRFVAEHFIHTSLSGHAPTGSTHFVPIGEEDLDIRK